MFWFVYWLPSSHLLVFHQRQQLPGHCNRDDALHDSLNDSYQLLCFWSFEDDNNKLVLLNGHLGVAMNEPWFERCFTHYELCTTVRTILCPDGHVGDGLGVAMEVHRCWQFTLGYSEPAQRC